MKLISVPQSGKCGPVVYVNSRWGLIARQRVVPKNPQTRQQQDNRRGFGAASKHWGTLSEDQQSAWDKEGARKYKVTAAGVRVPLSGYSYCVSVNSRQANLGLPLFDLPPAPPTFSPNPVGELAATNLNSKVTLKLRVPSAPAQYTFVEAAKPMSSGVRCVQHFPRLGLLSPPIDGWSDVTEMVVARYGELRAGQRIWIRTCQQIDGCTDVPKLTSIRIPGPTS